MLPLLHYVVLPNPRNDAVLLLPERKGWSLPRVADAEHGRWHALTIARELERRWQLQASVRRCLDVRAASDAREPVYTYLGEVHTDGWAPRNGARWAEPEQLDRLTLAVPEQRQIILDWFAWEQTDCDVRAAWYTPGWRDRAARWMSRQLADLGATTRGPIEQLRSWQRSYVMRQDTEQGRIYLKAAPVFFRHETALTGLLNQLFPALVPDVLAIHPTEPWMLLEDVGDETLADIADLGAYEETLARYAQLQIDLAAHRAALQATGCPTCTLDSLEGDFEALLRDRPALFVDDPRGLTGAQASELSQLLSRLPALVAELYACDLPLTLEHGDLWPMQITMRHGVPCFMDWSDAVLTHPLFSPAFFTRLEAPIFLRIEIAGRHLATRLPEARRRFRDAYLEPFTRYATRRELARAYAVAQPLAGIYHALQYWQRIIPGLEFKEEMHYMLPFYLRQAISAHHEV